MHPKGTSCGRPHWAIRTGVPPVSIRGGRCASLRSALIPNIHYSRSLLFWQKRLCYMWNVESGIWNCCSLWQSHSGIYRSTSFRSALEPNIYYSRSLLIERHAGVMFPDTLIPGAGYKVSLRAQSERSERLRELTPAARRRINNDCKRAKKMYN